MKILRLQADNFKRLGVVEITPTRDVVTLTGRNAQGKSSVLDAIFAAMAGKDAVPGKPIRHGETSAKITLDLGEVIVTRRFNERGTDVIVEAVSGARFGSPQRMLDGMIGALAFDPQEFLREKPPQQLATLRRLVKIDADLDALAGLNAKDFETRTEINRKANDLRAQAEGIVLPADCPTEPRDTVEILNRLQAAGDHNAKVERERFNRENARQQILDHRKAAADVDAALPAVITEIERRRDADVENLRARIREIEDEIAKRTVSADERIAGERSTAGKYAKGERQKADDIEVQLDDLNQIPAPIDAAAVRAELTSAEDNNRLVEQWQRRGYLTVEAYNAGQTAEELTARINARKKAAQDALAAAKFPIDGLSFGDGEVTYNGIPLSQASTAEQIRISMAIAMAANPKLRVVCIREGEKLDADGLQIIASLAKEHDYQVWLEDCRSTDPLAIVLEDGHIRPAADRDAAHDEERAPASPRAPSAAGSGSPTQGSLV